MENNNVDIGKEEADQTTVSLPSLEALDTSQEDLVNQNPQDIKDLFRKVEEEVAGIKFASKRLKRKIMAQGRAFHFPCTRRNFRWIALLCLHCGILLLLAIYVKRKSTDNHSINESLMGTGDVYSRTVPLNDKKPLVELFTTFTDNPKKVDIYKNTLMNWVQLDPAIRTTVFTDSSLPSTLDCYQNISVHPLTRANQYGYPFLKDLFFEADKLCRGEFIGLANADILFDEGLRETMMAAKEYFKDDKNASVLVVGVRMNANITYAQNSLYKTQEVTEFAKDYSNNSYQHPRSSDYFFMKNIQSFPWHILKDVVIGTLSFDSYLIHMANLANVSVVDATKTLLGLHQTGLDGNFASRTPDHAAIYFNQNLTNLVLGCGTSVPATKFYSDRDEGGAVKIFPRNKIIDPMPHCQGKIYKK